MKDAQPVEVPTFFAEVASSVSPAAVRQWFTYLFTIRVTNESRGPLTLSTDSLLQIGAGLPHVCESSLQQETVVQAGQTAALAFSRVRVCGFLPAGDYHPVLLLKGHDNQLPFTQQLETTSNPVGVVAEPVDPETGSEAAAPVYDFVATTNGALLRYRIKPASKYPTDVQFTLEHPAQFFEPCLADGSPAEQHVFTDLLGPSETPLLVKPKPGLEPGKRYSEGRFLTWNVFQVKCPHEGIGLVVPLTLPLLGSLDTDPRLQLLSLDVTPVTVHPGEVFAATATMANAKGYGIGVDVATGATRIRVVKDGLDVSPLFLTEQVVGPYVEGGFTATEEYQVRVRADLSVAPGVYTLYPVVRTTREGFDGAAAVEFCALMDGEQAQPIVQSQITVLPSS